MTVHWLETSLLPGYCQLVYLMKRRNFLIRKKRRPQGSPYFFVKLSYPFLFGLVSSSDLPISTPSPFVCTSYILVFLLFICFSVLDRMMWKQSIRLAAVVAGSLSLPKTLKCGESNFDTKSCGLPRSGPWKSGCCGETQHDHSWRFLIRGGAAVLSGVSPSADHNTAGLVRKTVIPNCPMKSKQQCPHPHLYTLVTTVCARCYGAMHFLYITCQSVSKILFLLC